MLDILTTFILLVQVYYIGMAEDDPVIKGQYRIVLIILFLATFAPFWISYSSLVKIMEMDGRYEETLLEEKGRC